MMTCQRCGKETQCSCMSIFNTQMICMECEAKEHKHPKYQEARQAELVEVRAGNYNFGGIGRPADL